MVMLVLFELFSRKFCLNFLTLILSASPNIMHFVCTFSIMRALCYRRGSKLWKNCIGLLWGAVCKATQYKILHHFLVKLRAISYIVAVYVYCSNMC